jgi:dihydrofolate reductase
MSLARVQNFSISLDGFGTGEGQSADAPFGHAGDRLHEWMFATRWWREMIGEPGGTGGIDDAFAQLFGPGIGAEIMGAKKFGPPGWHEDQSGRARGVPTRRSTHRSSSSLITRAHRSRWRAARRSTLSTLRLPRRSRRPARPRAATTYASAGGPTVIRDFLAAGLVDHMHIVVVPILLGRGVRLWDGLEGLEKDYQVDATSSPSGVTHVTFTRAGA